MSVLTQFIGGGIKSIQRGTTNVPASGAVVTISAVNPAKTQVNYLGSYHGGGSTFDDLGCICRLVSGTSLSFNRGGSAGTIVFSWEVIESY